MTAGRKSPVGFYSLATATMEAGLPECRQPGRRHRLHPAEWAAVESRSQASAEGEQMIGNRHPMSKP